MRWAKDEDVLERRLAAEFDAEIVYPETLVFAEQIAKFAEADFVVGCEGSAFYTAMFVIIMTLLHRHGTSAAPTSPSMSALMAEEVSNGCSTYL